MTDRIKYLLESIEGLNWIAILTLVFFFLLFVVIVYLTWTRKKTFNDYMANLPLEDADNHAEKL
jgi:cbb3-type cytochrome oxidase subunit 3